MDGAAKAIADAAELQGLALQGLLERTYRNSRNVVGLNTFAVVSEDMRDGVQRSTWAIVDQFAEDAARHLVLGEPTGLFADEFSELEIALVAHFDQLRGLYLRQLKHMMASRSAVADMLVRSPLSMTRSGAQIPTGEFAFLVARRSLLDWFNLNQLEALRRAGHTTALVIHKDVEHEDHGVEIALEPGTDLPLYQDIADEIFHPRANAVIGAS